MLNDLIKTSSFARLLEKGCIMRFSIELWLFNIYKNSRTNRLIQNFKERTKAFFRYSWLGKISEAKQGENSFILTESLILMHLVNVYKKYKAKAIQCLVNAKDCSLVGQIKINPCTLPLKAMAVILVVAVFTNTISYFLLGQKIESMSWIMRGLLLFAGIAALSSNAGWPVVRENSVILRWIFKNVRDLRKDKL
jgi:hypothetical protein